MKRSLLSTVAVLLALLLLLGGCNGGDAPISTTDVTTSALLPPATDEGNEVPAADPLYERFVSGDVSLRPHPLFFWNKALSQMDEDELREIIRGCYEKCGYGGFGILPYWLDGYLTDEYFDLYEAALDEGSKYGMQFSLYDENGFPSYTAGGLLAAKYPELTAKRLDMISKTATSGQTVRLELPRGQFMGGVLMNTQTFERINISDSAVIVEDTEGYAPGYYSSSDFSSGYIAEYGFDGNTATRWNAADGTSGDQWLMEVFDREVTIDKVYISEAFDRIRSFDIQYWDGEGWVTCASGTRVGSSKTITFDPITTTRIRLYEHSIVSDSVSIWEFAAYLGDTKVEVDPEAIQNAQSYLEYTVPEGNWKVMAFVCVKDGTKGMDYLSREAVKAYIEVTYEAYYERFEKYFGTTITTAFFDEPCMWPSNQNYGVEGARFWTPGFNEAFARTYGDEIDPVLFYPALFGSIGADTVEARDKLETVRSTLFAENYVGQIDQWCRDHKIKLTGHMNEEQSKNPVGLHGDLMKVFKDQAIPGIDVIWHYGQAQNAYKVVSSAAYNWDKGLVMSEAFGDISSATPDTIQKITLDLYAKGINLIVPHAVWYDMNNVVFKPELSYRNRQFAKALPAYTQYVSRLNALLQNGRHVADIAVLYPIDYLESEFYFNGTYNEPAIANYMEVGEYLSLNKRVDFTYLHPDLLDSKISIADGVMHLDNQTNYEDYRTVILTGSDVISLANLQKIYAFWQSGGNVISVGRIPTKGITVAENAQVVKLLSEMFALSDISSQPAQSENVSEKGGRAIHISSVNRLSDALDKAVEVFDVEIEGVPATLQGGGFSYIHKVLDGRNIWFFANSSDRSVEARITLRGEYETLELWDPAQDTRITVTPEVSDGVSRLTIEVDKISSFFIVEPNAAAK